VPVPDSNDSIHLSIHLVSYEPRPRPELEPTQPSEPNAGPIVWRGKMSTGYWVGPLFLKAPEDTVKVEFEHEGPHQGEVDIQLHVAAGVEVSKAQLKSIATSISYSTLSYINIALGDLLVPVAPIQIRRLGGERESQYENDVSVFVKERRTFSAEVLEQRLYEYVGRRLQMSEKEKFALDAAMRRYLTSLTELDEVDKFSDLWETCEFATFDVKAKGTIVSRISQALTNQMQRADIRRSKANVENTLQVKALYQVRKDLVHNAVENPARLQEYTALLSEIAAELIRFRLGLNYQRTAMLEEAFNSETPERENS
jgi:Apea-like HEPN